MRDSFQAALDALEKLDTLESLAAKNAEIKKTQHNTSAALREARTEGSPAGPGRSEENNDTPESLTAKNAEITSGHNLGLRDHLLRVRRELRARSDPPGDTGEKPRENLPTPKRPTAKTAEITEAERLGLVATWSSEFGYVSIHDPTTGEWHDLQTKEAPAWAVSEAHKRKALYRDGNRRAYRLTSREMEELWQREHLAGEAEEGIVEEHPVEEG